MVLGELAYMLIRPTFAPPGQPPRTRQQVARYLLGVLTWPGIEMEDKNLAAWEAGTADDLVDCYLQARAEAHGERVCTVNLRHFPGAAHPADLLGRTRPGQPRPPRRRRQ